MSGTVDFLCPVTLGIPPCPLHTVLCIPTSWDGGRPCYLQSRELRLFCSPLLSQPYLSNVMNNVLLYILQAWVGTAAQEWLDLCHATNVPTYGPLQFVSVVVRVCSYIDHVRGHSELAPVPITITVGDCHPWVVHCTTAPSAAGARGPLSQGSRAVTLFQMKKEFNVGQLFKPSNGLFGVCLDQIHCHVLLCLVMWGLER